MLWFVVTSLYLLFIDLDLLDDNVSAFSVNPIITY